ncbi:MAG: SEC-C domain-containing protein, partial [Firmicutes bacterium]|nr:SEC-C domain-containing protein [Bacillota bacterium]
IDFEKLFYNMLEAEADYLYTLEAWADVLPEERLIEIVKEYKKSKTVHVEKKPGRNDPCPCGSGKKYKKCCGK